MKAAKPTTRQLIDRAALAIVAAYALTTIHHIYGGLVDGAPNRLRVPPIMAIPSLITLGSLYRYKRTGSGPALATSKYLQVNIESPRLPADADRALRPASIQLPSRRIGVASGNL